MFGCGNRYTKMEWPSLYENGVANWIYPNRDASEERRWKRRWNLYLRDTISPQK